MKLFANKTNFIYSPLEQFDSMTWVFYNRVLDYIKPYNRYVLELDYTQTDLITHPSRAGVLSEYYWFSNAAAYTLVFFLVVKLLDQYLPLRDFSHLFLLASLHLFFGSVVFMWFDDVALDGSVLTHVMRKTGLRTQYFIEDNSVQSFGWSPETPDSRYVVESLDILWLPVPQLDISIAWDENFISLLLGLFLLGGSEEEEDEDFVLEEEGGDFVEDVVAPLFVTNLGKDVEENGALFLKVCGVFSFVFTNNIMGMLPYSDTATSSLLLTFWVSLSIFTSLLTMMIRRNGVKYLFSFFLPAGSPFALAFLLVPLEFVSYSFRLVSLPVRLFANMMAGHILLKVIVGFSWSMILMGDLFLLANLFPVVVLFVLTFLELAVAAIQAYVFTILTCMYLRDVFVAH
jgi:ATP synthase subunit 6